MKNAKLDEAMKDYELYGVDPDDTMMLTDEEWANSRGLDVSDIVYPEQSDLDACIYALMEVERKIAELKADIEETTEQIDSEKNYMVKTELRNDVTSLRMQIERLKIEYKKLMAELERLRAERSGQIGSR